MGLFDFLGDALAGFATGGQPSAKQSGTPYNEMYNSSNRSAQTAYNNTVGGQVKGAQAPGGMYFDPNQGRIIDPTNGNPLGSVVERSGSGSTSGTSGSSTPSYSQDDVNYLNDQEARLKQQLERLMNTQDDGLTKLKDSYNKEVTGANRQRGRALEDLQLQREDTTRAKQSAIGEVDNNAFNLNNTLRKLIGRASGTGSSAYQFAAPDLVAKVASGQRTGVMEDYGQNFRDLATTEERAKSDFELLLEELAERRRDAESNFRAGVGEQRIGLNTALADLIADRTKLMGGGYGDTRIAQQPYLDRINQSESAIDGLFDKYRTPFESVKPVQVNAPQLRDYTVDRAAINANNQFGSNSASPYMQFLQRQREEENRE